VSLAQRRPDVLNKSDKSRPARAPVLFRESAFLFPGHDEFHQGHEPHQLARVPFHLDIAGLHAFHERHLVLAGGTQGAERVIRVAEIQGDGGRAVQTGAVFYSN